MNPVNAHKLMETMQSIAQAAKGPNAQIQGQGEFGKALQNAIDKTNDLQQTSSALAAKYEQGDPSVELIDVMIASQKSSVSFQALTQVRNRLVNAYQDIMNMQI